MTAGGVPAVISHRGARGLAPENTQVSLAVAAREGARWVEFDVKLTRDGVPVLFHDDDLARTAGVDGLLADLTLAEVKELDVGSYFSPAFDGEPVPTLAEAVEVLGELRLGAKVELKPCSGREEETGRVVAGLLKEIWPGHLPPPLLSSFEGAALRAARTIAPAYARALLVRAVPGDWQARVRDLDCGSLHVAADQLTFEAAKVVGGAGIALRCFTVDDPAEAESLFAWGVQSVFSDFPGALLRRLGT